MENSQEKLDKIRAFITNYVKYSKERGRMYGTIAMLEMNWVLLDRIYFILEELEDVERDCNFTAFLISKGYGPMSTSQIIEEINPKAKDPYAELNKLRNEYEEWRSEEIKKIMEVQENKKNKGGC
jgi:hypothetical protein